MAYTPKAQRADNIRSKLHAGAGINSLEGLILAKLGAYFETIVQDLSADHVQDNRKLVYEVTGCRLTIEDPDLAAHIVSLERLRGYNDSLTGETSIVLYSKANATKPVRKPRDPLGRLNSSIGAIISYAHRRGEVRKGEPLSDSLVERIVNANSFLRNIDGTISSKIREKIRQQQPFVQEDLISLLNKDGEEKS